MENRQICIGNARYRVERIFSGEKSAEELLLDLLLRSAMEGSSFDGEKDRSI